MKYCEILRKSQLIALMESNASIFMKIEVSRILHNSFTIAWGILGVMILVLLPITEYLNIPKELYITLATVLVQFLPIIKHFGIHIVCRVVNFVGPLWHGRCLNHP